VFSVGRISKQFGVQCRKNLMYDVGRISKQMWCLVLEESSV